MVSVKHEYIWRLLEDHHFQCIDPINKDFLCTICKTILKNACQIPCGCRFCLGCITTYLDGVAKCCPGDTEDCKEQMINFDKVLQTDYVMNKKISMLIVKCPEESCSFTDQLKNMKDHLSTHKEICPYFPIGCQNQSETVKNISNHLNNDPYSHALLLMTTINKMENEVQILKESITLLKEESERKNMVLMELENRLNDIGINQKEQSSDLTGEIKKPFELKNRFEIKNEGSQLDSKSGKTLTKMEMRIENKVIKRSNSFVSLTQLPLTSEPKLYSPFIWNIKHFSPKLAAASSGIKRFIVSDAFYSFSNGYKMCLIIYPYGYSLEVSSYLSVFVHIMKGEYDNKLSWPMMHKLRICLLDQMYGNTIPSADKRFCYHTSAQNRLYMFERPFENRNDGIGDPKFINRNNVFNNKRIFDKDSIIIRCSVD